MHEFNRHRAKAISASPFQVTYAQGALAGELNDERHLLAAIHYASDNTDAPTSPGHIAVSLRPLGDSLVEVWRSRAPLERGQTDNIFFSRNEDVLFGHLCLAERDHGGLDAAVFEAYRRIYAFALGQEFPHPLRIWNFLPDINDRQGELERYQVFCEGRNRALEQLTMQPDQLPAASAIGTQQGELQVYFVAARDPGSQVENPRQVSAFHYPRRYSPKSPAFSRAVVKYWGAAAHLYISGTASIVGHESRHPLDTVAQLDETLDNLEALVCHAGRLHPLGIHSVRQLSLLKLYVRGVGDQDAVITRLCERLGAVPPVLLLHGDICRGDLRLEIEGLYTGKGAAD